MTAAPRRVLLISFAVLLFLGLWLAMMIGAMAAGGCRKEAISEPRRLRLCNTALFLPGFPGEAPKRAAIYLERRILLSRMDAPERARQDFRRAFHDTAEAGRTASGARYRAYRAALETRIAREPESSVARMIWREVTR